MKMTKTWLPRLRIMLMTKLRLSWGWKRTMIKLRLSWGWKRTMIKLRLSWGWRGRWRSWGFHEAEDKVDNQAEAFMRLEENDDQAEAFMRLEENDDQAKAFMRLEENDDQAEAVMTLRKRSMTKHRLSLGWG
jgi:hypothetical protein